MKTILLYNATIVTSEKEAVGSILIKDGKIAKVIYKEDEAYDYHLFTIKKEEPEVWNLEGRWLMAGGIDAHVHFREPGLTHKADMETESMAAVAGGVTSVLDMPNTSPTTTSAESLKAKLQVAEGRVATNIGFNIGAICIMETSKRFYANLSCKIIM